jgi:hypothetical protein
MEPTKVNEIIYKSTLPDIHIPKISVFASLFPVNDKYPGERPAIIDGLTGETWSRQTLRQRALTLAAAMIYDLGLRSA